MQVACEPLNPSELPKMVEGLRKIERAYPLAVSKVRFAALLASSAGWMGEGSNPCRSIQQTECKSHARIDSIFGFIFVFEFK